MCVFIFILEVTLTRHVIHLILYMKATPSKKIFVIFFWYENRNKIVVKTIYFHLSLVISLLSVIYKCFAFRVFGYLRLNKVAYW